MATTAMIVEMNGIHCFQPSENTFLNSLGWANLYPVNNKILAKHDNGILFK